MSLFFLSCTLPASSSCNLDAGLLSLSELSGDVVLVGGIRGLGGTLRLIIVLSIGGSTLRLIIVLLVFHTLFARFINLINN